MADIAIQVRPKVQPLLMGNGNADGSTLSKLDVNIRGRRIWGPHQQPRTTANFAVLHMTYNARVAELLHRTGRLVLVLQHIRRIFEILVALKVKACFLSTTLAKHQEQW
jgi:hypothetical protein